jgi:radical SAM protein with 4Fe4S-binding SPASM domain
MQTQDYFNFFDELKELGTRTVSFSGGEPVLRRDLVELISYAKKCGFYVSLGTNGTLMTQDLAKRLIETNVDLIQLSIDSSHPKIHDQLRGNPGSWSKTTNGLKNLDFFRKKMKTKTEIFINSVITMLNFKELHEILDMKNFLDFDQINFLPLYEQVQSSFIEKLRLGNDEKEYFTRNIAPMIEKKAIMYGIKANAYAFGNQDQINSQENDPRHVYESTYCFMPWYYLEVLQNGDVIPCNHAGTEMVMGNVVTQSFHNIWAGKKYIDFRKRCRPPSFSMCNNCWCFLDNNLRLMQMYRRIPSRLRKILE